MLQASTSTIFGMFEATHQLPNFKDFMEMVDIEIKLTYIQN